MSITRQITPRGAIGFIALALALGGGVAVGAGEITSRDIKNATIKSSDVRNDALRTKDLNVPLGGDGFYSEEKATLGPSFKEIARTELALNDGGGWSIAEGVVELTNTGGAAAQVTIRFRHLGHPEHDVELTSTVAPGATESAPVSIRCNGMPAGVQTLVLEASGPASVSVSDRTFNAVVVPRI